MAMTEYFTNKKLWPGFEDGTCFLVYYVYTPAWRNPKPLIIQEEPSTDGEIEIAEIEYDGGSVLYESLTMAQIDDLEQKCYEHAHQMMEQGREQE